MSLNEAVKDVQQQLMEAGEKLLLRPPSSVDELLSILDLADNALEKVEQSPGKSMQDALTSLRKALVSDELLGHPDTDVKVFVAACISEVTRITAPDAPYDDEKMKRVFQLIVSSFEDLSDKSSRSYTKRISILETVAKVRSCVIMLDLECDDLILKMFQIFFRTIRDYHPDRIFTSMEIIMNLVLEESEEVSNDLLTTLLSSVKRNNEEVPPIARRLGERIFTTSASKLKPYLTQATKNSEISLNNYSKVLTSVCEGAVGRDATNASVLQQNGGCQAAVATTDATQEGDGCKVAAASAEETQEDDDNNTAVASSKEIRVGDGTKVAAASSEETQQDAKDVERDSLGDNSHSAKRSPKTTLSNETNVTSEEKTSVNGELSLKGDNCETENKSTNDEAIPKPDSHASGVDKETVSVSKNSEMISKNSQKEASLTNKSEGSSEPSSHVDCEKGAKMSDNLDSHEKDTASSLDEDISPEPKNVENAKETGGVEPCNGRKDSNAASPSPSAEKANDNLLKRDGHQQAKDCATHGEVSSPGMVSEKESGRASDLSGESPDKKAHQEVPLKDETSVEIATPNHEDSGTSDSVDKLVKEPAKKFDVRDSDDDGAPLKKKADLIKCARTKARPGKGASKSPGRITEKESERASDSEEASGESPDKKAHQESPLKDETSVEVPTPKHEDSGASDSEDKLVKEHRKKSDLRDSSDDGAPLKKKADLIKRARTKARPGKGSSKSPGTVIEKESERASDLEQVSGESPLKDETSVEVAPPKDEDSGTSDSEDKLVKEPRKKFDLRDSDDDGAPLKKKADLIKRAHTKARSGKGASKSPGRVTEKESERASDLEVSGESPLEDETSVEVATPKDEDSGTSDSEDKLVKEPTKKFDLGDSDDDGAPLKKKADLIKRARTKARSGKGASKSSIKDDVKKVGSSQNRTAKSAKAKVDEDEIFSKRKRSLGKDSSGSLKYGKNLIRSRVKVWWPIDHQFYEGVIVSYDPDKRKHQVLYDDGEEELLNLRKEKWQLVGDEVTGDDAEPASTDASSEMPKSKKVKKSATSFAKQQDLDDVSPKRLSLSSSKSKGKSSTSGKQTKNVKAETKSKDLTSKFGSPKSSGKAKDLDDSTLKSKSKQDTPRIAVKSKETTPKTAGKSKEDTTKTAVKGKTQGSGSKSSANGAGKGKSNLSKGKGSNVQEKRSESPEVAESTKRKLSDSLKDHGSEFKGVKKQKRSIRG